MCYCTSGRQSPQIHQNMSESVLVYQASLKPKRLLSDKQEAGSAGLFSHPALSWWEMCRLALTHLLISPQRHRSLHVR